MQNMLNTSVSRCWINVIISIVLVVQCDLAEKQWCALAQLWSEGYTLELTHEMPGTITAD